MPGHAAPTITAKTFDRVVLHFDPMKAQGTLTSHNPLTTAAAKYGAKKHMLK